MTDDIWRLSATDLAARIRARAISAREAAQAALDRLDAVNQALNAVIDHDPAAVLARADSIDAALAADHDPGVLAGVPVTVKSNIDQLGFATSNGLVAQSELMPPENSPVVDNLERAGAVIIGRTNTPAFSLRWFTDNQLHGQTFNPRDRSLTPGGSSGGAASAVTAGIGHIAHGTDIGGSIRYPAYACGVHGLRPSLGRIPAWNPSGPERTIGFQLMAVSGPIGRTIADLHLAMTAMIAPDARDPWHVPLPLDRSSAPRRAALCLRPNGLPIAPEVEAALHDAADRLRRAGWVVEEIADTPSFRDATRLQVRLWLGNDFDALDAAAARENDPGAIAVVNAFRDEARALPPDVVNRSLTERATLTRIWGRFLDEHPIVLLPVSGALPFPQDADRQDGVDGFRRVWDAQLVQTGLPLMGLPGLTVSTGLVGPIPVGVQLIAGRYREDWLLEAGSAIEAGGAPVSPIDPIG